MRIKKGDWVKHTLTNETYEVKKVNERIAVLNCQQPFEATKFRDEVRIAICNVKNLKLVNHTKQLSFI